MKVSVLIAHINSPKNLTETIRNHMRALEDIPHEIIICDNGSDPENVDYIKHLVRLYPEELKLTHESIRGTVAPFQKAAKLATGEYLCISDQHIMIPKDFYKKQLAILESRPDIGTLYACCSMDRYGTDYCYQYGFSYGYNWRSGYIKKPNKPEPYPVLVSQMGCVLIRRKLFNKFGGYSKNCFDKWGGYTAEEICLGLKTWMWGSKVYFNPNNYYRHYGLYRESASGRKTEFAPSFTTLAYLLGGDKWMESVADAWSANMYGPGNYYTTREEALADIKQYTAEDREWVLQHQKISFDELIERFKKGEIE